MVKVYCEVVDDAGGLQWRIIAEAGALGKYVGEWQHSHKSFATLKAPTGEGGRMQTWIAGTDRWSKTRHTLGEFPEFTPISLGDYVGSGPVEIERPSIFSSPRIEAHAED